MLDTILIVDATMIAGILFAQSIGRSYGIRTPYDMGRWMAILGWFVLLPFSLSAILALGSNFWAPYSAGMGFLMFISWFLIPSTMIGYLGGRVRATQRTVEETELATFLQDGWVVVAVLKSGRVVVEK